MLAKIVWKNIVAKKLRSSLTITLMALGISLVAFLSLISKKIEDKFLHNITGIDMVVGAKGSPLQLILSSIFQIDSPTGNIFYDDLMAIRNNPLVKQIIPLSMGDSYQGVRIVGTNQDYLNHFEAKFYQGKTFEKNMEVVVGSAISEQLGLKINSSFESSHGLDKHGEKHKNEVFKVVGILKPNNSVIDNLILCNLESVWEVHEKSDNQHLEVTSGLVKFRSPMGLLAIPRNINQNSNMQAALPSIEINRLFTLMGFGVETLKYLAILIIVISGLSVFVSLYNALKERKYEMALMYAMGAQRFKLFLMLLSEGLVLSFAGYCLGIILSRIGLYAASSFSNQIGYQLFMPPQREEIILLGFSLLIGTLAAVLPSFGVYKINISKTLANE